MDLLAEVNRLGCFRDSIKAPLDGGRQSVYKLVNEFRVHDCLQPQHPTINNHNNIDNLVTTALQVDPARIAIPEIAGTVDPAKYLPKERREVFNDLHRLKLPEESWGVIPRACHRVPLTKEDEMARKLLHSHMALLVPERDLPRTKAGAILKGGFFCVAKNASEDRLIYDRRPEYSTMQKLDWLRLPSASCFRKRLLKPGQFLRGLGDDLRNYYYMLALPEDWICHNCVGRSVSASVIEEFVDEPIGGNDIFFVFESWVWGTTMPAISLRQLMRPSFKIRVCSPRSRF